MAVMLYCRVVWGGNGDRDPHERGGRRRGKANRHRPSRGERLSPRAYPHGLHDGHRAARRFHRADVVITKDGVLIARHENEIGATTDAASHPEFAGRRTEKSIDGH